MGIDDDLDRFYRSKQKHFINKLDDRGHPEWYPKIDLDSETPVQEAEFDQSQELSSLLIGLKGEEKNISEIEELAPVHKGRANELIAAKWLQDQGYYVAHNVGWTGPFDLVAVNAEGTRYFDVRTASVHVLGGVRVFSAGQKIHDSAQKVPHAKIELIYVYKDQVKFALNRIVPDWEGL